MYVILCMYVPPNVCVCIHEKTHVCNLSASAYMVKQDI